MSGKQESATRRRIEAARSADEKLGNEATFIVAKAVDEALKSAVQLKLEETSNQIEQDKNG